jgi:hypothetical protein
MYQLIIYTTQVRMYEQYCAQFGLCNITKGTTNAIFRCGISVQELMLSLLYGNSDIGKIKKYLTFTKDL